MVILFIVLTLKPGEFTLLTCLCLPLIHLSSPGKGPADQGSGSERQASEGLPGPGPAVRELLPVQLYWNVAPTSLDPLFPGSSPDLSVKISPFLHVGSSCKENQNEKWKTPQGQKQTGKPFSWLPVWGSVDTSQHPSPCSWNITLMLFVFMGE